MAISKVTVKFDSDIKTIWNRMTNVNDASWRSDLASIQVVDEKQFIEHSKDGFATNFHVVTCIPHQVWEFQMENKNIAGYWKGIFHEEEGNVSITFIEEIHAKKLMLKPFVKMYLKKQQALYIQDLKRALDQ